MITTVLFDLDGTLLPMDQELFVKTYFQGLAARLAPHGYAPDELIRAIWAGTAAMVSNDGARTNEEVFWADFCSRFGPAAREDEPKFEDFYREDFPRVRHVCGFTPQAAATVQWLKSRGIRLALATNPIFPAIATRQRIAWAGLREEDFEIVTTYENSRFSKPDLRYYRDLLEQLGVTAEECLMVGNDVDEDMIAGDLGMRVFLLTDHIINKRDCDIAAYPHGNFDDLRKFLSSLIG